ncbi:MAG: hypothetical protein JSV91_02980 [Phycisphaerales bacterium]|nr:MAG: hypothetical protein JSV91_02980 [Phycisphaerales bacterium]
MSNPTDGGLGAMKGLAMRGEGEGLPPRVGSGIRRLAGVLMIATLASATGCSGPERSAPQQSDGAASAAAIRPRIEVTVLVVGIDAKRAGETQKYRHLREYAGVEISPEGRRWARSWNDITALVGSLRDMGAVNVLAQPAITVRSGAAATIRMQSGDRSTMSLSLGANERTSGRVLVDVELRFDGDERDNRFEDLRFRSPGIRFMSERLFVEQDRIEGAELRAAGGQITSPAELRMYVFVSARRDADM